MKIGKGLEHMYGYEKILTNLLIPEEALSMKLKNVSHRSSTNFLLHQSITEAYTSTQQYSAQITIFIKEILYAYCANMK